MEFHQRWVINREEIEEAIKKIYNIPSGAKIVFVGSDGGSDKLKGVRVYHETPGTNLNIDTSYDMNTTV